MKKYIAAFAAVIALVLPATAGAVPTTNQGYAIAGDFYGNTSNPSGNGEGVLPSYAPGPWKCDYNPGCDGPTDNGASIGDYASAIQSEGQSQAQFANGNDQNIDFSAAH